MNDTVTETLTKGVEMHLAGEFGFAIQLYNSVLKLEPNHADANHNIGLLKLDTGHELEALPYLQTALEADKSIAQFWLSYIKVLIKLDRTEDAARILKLAKQNGVKGKEFNQLHQKVAKSTNDSIVPKPVSEVQDPPQSQLQLLLNLYSQGQYGKVLECVSQLLRQFKNSVSLHNLNGAANTALGLLDAAEESFQRAISIKPDQADAYNNIGSVLEQKGKLEGAIEVFEKAICIKPDYAEAYSNMGIVLKKQGRLEEAVKAFNKALEIKPDDVKAYSNMGNAFNDQGKLEEAIAAYNKAIAINPEYANAWSNLAFPLQAIKTQALSKGELARLYPREPYSKTFRIEKSILNYRLHRGGARASSAMDKAIDLISSADGITIKNPNFSKLSYASKPDLPNAVVALVHFGRSGTGLLHSLIDGHSAVSTLPSIYLSQYFRFSTWEKIVSNGIDKIADNFIRNYDVLFDASSKSPVPTKSKYEIFFGQKEGMTSVGASGNEVLFLDKRLFRNELNRLLSFYREIDAFLLLKIIQKAYDKALNDQNKKSIIFYHIHNPDSYAELNFVRLVPNAKWVIMIREPIQSCESWISEAFRNNEYSEIVNKIFGMLFEIDNIVYHKQDSIGLRLEDLKEYPRKTIPALCKWMGIKESESLYQMTAQGKKWWGDPSSVDYSKDGKEPFGRISIKRKVGAVFSESDQFILRTLFYPFSVRFGYAEENLDQFKSDLQQIRPLLHQMFDFEQKIIERTECNPEQFMKSGPYLYLRSGLIERWDILNKHLTYPNIIKRLEIG